MLRVPVDDVLPVYRALVKFSKMLASPENSIQYRLRGGKALPSYPSVAVKRQVILLDDITGLTILLRRYGGWWMSG